MTKRPRKCSEMFDELYQLALDYDWTEFEWAMKEERVDRITDVCADVAYAHEFMTEPEFEPYAKELRGTFRNDCEWDQAVSPAMLRTDFERAIKSRYTDTEQEQEALAALRTYGNDHVLTVLIRFLVSDDVFRYREHVQLNHARCEPILCARWPDQFEWLAKERLEDYIRAEEAKARKAEKMAKKAMGDGAA